MGGVGWTQPPRGVVKVNVDAGCMQGLGSSVGVVIRDDKREVLVCMMECCSDLWEAKAIHMGMRLAAEHESMDTGEWWWRVTVRV